MPKDLIDIVIENFENECFFCNAPYCLDCDYYVNVKQATFMGFEDKPQNVDTNTCVASSYECQLNDKS